MPRLGSHLAQEGLDLGHYVALAPVEGVYRLCDTGCGGCLGWTAAAVITRYYHRSFGQIRGFDFEMRHATIFFVSLSPTGLFYPALWPVSISACSPQHWFPTAVLFDFCTTFSCRDAHGRTTRMNSSDGRGPTCRFFERVLTIHVRRGQATTPPPPKKKMNCTVRS